MIKNYILIAFRNLLKYKFYSILNIMGLAIGIACFYLIYIYVQYELSYDKSYENHDRIYRVSFEGSFGGREFETAQVNPAMGPALLNDYPEIESFVRFRNRGSELLEYNKVSYKEEKVAYADSNVFNMFELKLLKGNSDQALKNPNTVVLNESTANKIFGTIDCIGENLKLNGRDNYEVTGVLMDMPENMHLDFNVLMSMSSIEEAESKVWLSLNFVTYFMFKPNVDVENFKPKFSEVIEKYIGPDVERFIGSTMEEFYESGNKVSYDLLPVSAIHLYSNIDGELSVNSDIKYVYIFSAVAIFILVIACINFMNLSTARSTNRAHEVGLRKVMGAVKKQLILQFLTESMLMAFLSTILAIVLVILILPLFNQIAEKSFSIIDIFQPDNVLSLAILVGIVGLFSGSYPAFFLSDFKIMRVLKGNLKRGRKSGYLRSGLVVFQFGITIVLIVCTLVVKRQLSFIQNKKLGYNTNQILVLEDTYMLNGSLKSFKDEVLANTNFQDATVTGFIPTPSYRSATAFFPGSDPKSDKTAAIEFFIVDDRFLPTYDLQVIAGRNFDRSFTSDSLKLILNESAVKHFGFQDPINQVLSTYEGNNQDDLYVQPMKVVGVIEDFHFASLHQKISPLVLRYGDNTGKISFKLQTDNYTEAVGFLKTKWEEFAPGQPFEYSFINQELSSQYEEEEKIAHIFSIFSIIAIFVACLGLLGLAAFTAQQRTKEIGVRKVLGASISSILLLLSKEFFRLIVISMLISVPIAYWAMNSWLQDFEYRTTIGFNVFALAGLLAILISTITMSLQSLKAAYNNPINALRSE